MQSPPIFAEINVIKIQIELPSASFLAVFAIYFKTY